MRWQEIADEIKERSQEINRLRAEWHEIRQQCAHVQLPRRIVDEPYMDTCPECGHVSYCYGV